MRHTLQPSIIQNLATMIHRQVLLQLSTTAGSYTVHLWSRNMLPLRYVGVIWLHDCQGAWRWEWMRQASRRCKDQTNEQSPMLVMALQLPGQP